MTTKTSFPIDQPTYKPEDYPLYEMVLDRHFTDLHRWLSLRNAAGWYDQGLFACGFGSWVIDKHGDIPRPMREEDHARIGELADEMSAAR